MRGLMGEKPLLVSSLIAHAARVHADTEIVSRTVEGPIHRYTYADSERRAKRLARALLRRGIKPGDRLGTLAWNGFRHFELYYGISGIGAVCHTINPRLFDDQIVYIVNHAEDRLIFLDSTFLPLVERLAARFPKECRFILLSEGKATRLPIEATYEELLACEEADFEWPQFDEWTASSLCYTSGTTGKPRGVLYAHRSTILHTLGSALPDAITLSAADVVAPVVPMFHANAWGSCYSAPMIGAKLVLPGPRLDGESLYELFEAEAVTLSLGVPTVWLGFGVYLRASGKRCSTLRRVLSGGSAVPASMIEDFSRLHNIEVLQGWGMTEMSPLGSTGALKRKHLALGDKERLAIKTKAGRAPYGVEMKLVDEEGRALPWDGKAVGELLVRGPWVISSYYNDPEASAAALTKDGWLRTGDVATIDPDGYMQITDRSKDIIKSGGEWISSIDLENAALAHPEVAEAAAIAVPHPRWGERPLLIVVPNPGCRPRREALIAYLGKRFPRWMVPDDVVLVEEIPHTATGKIMKSRLREMFASHRLPERG
jgi:3-(methylthio)propionyl---CoA ligase